MVFINFSNHHSYMWNDKQIAEAKKWGDIVDVDFPQIEPNATEDDIINLAKKYVDIILEYTPNAVMCQGEFTLTYLVVKLLREKSINVVAACSERVTTSVLEESGQVVKKSIYEFTGFRRYY